MALPELRAAGASRGPAQGVSPLDCGAAEPRQAYGGAALSDGSKIPSRKRLERDAEIVRLCAEGAPQTRVARKFGLARSSVVLILAKSQDDAQRKERIEAVAAREARRDRYAELYGAGFSIHEIAAREGISVPRIYRILRTHPVYEPRCAYNRFGFKCEVPAWVPPQHEARFRRIASTDGEEVAAGCLRKLKALEREGRA